MNPVFDFLSQEEMNGDEEGDPDEGRDLISWGCGEFGQHSHGHKEDVAFCDGLVKKFPTVPTKLIACGASHTILVTSKCPKKARHVANFQHSINVL